MPRKKIILIDSSRARQNFELVVGISKVGLLTVEPYDVNEIDR